MKRINHCSRSAVEANLIIFPVDMKITGKYGLSLKRKKDHRSIYITYQPIVRHRVFPSTD